MRVPTNFYYLKKKKKKKKKNFFIEYIEYILMY